MAKPTKVYDKEVKRGAVRRKDTGEVAGMITYGKWPQVSPSLLVRKEEKRWSWHHPAITTLTILIILIWAWLPKHSDGIKGDGTESTIQLSEDTNEIISP